MQIAYRKGLHELGDGLFAYLQPDGGWGWSNAGLITASDTSLLVDKGIERGQLRAGIDYELVHDLLFGPVYYRLLLSGSPLDDGLAERIVDAVWPALAARS